MFIFPSWIMSLFVSGVILPKHSLQYIFYASPLVINTLDFCLFEKSFISYPFWKDIFTCVWMSKLFFVSVLFFFSFIFISWRLITLQYCSGFCHTLTWMSHGFTCVPHPNPLPPPSLPDPSGSFQCTRPEHLSHASNLGWWSVSP